MDFKFFYGVDDEINIIKNTLGKINYYNEHSYRILLPKNFDVKNNNIEYIRKAVLDEYNGGEYKEISMFLENKVEENMAKIKSGFDKTDFIIEDTYNIYLTKYGVGGSYNPLNSIILNFKAKEKEKLFKTIIHETIHLCINKLIIKYNIPQWEKELLVDLTFDNILPEFNILQNIKLSEERKNEIKKIFALYFPNTEDIIKNLTSINTKNIA